MQYFFVFITCLSFCYAQLTDVGDLIVNKESLNGNLERKTSGSKVINVEHKDGYTLKLRKGQEYGYLVGLDKEMREDIYRPCKFDDWGCVREFFAANSRCTPAYGPAPDPLYLDENTFYYSNVNLTVTIRDVKVTGLSNMEIVEFYVNRETGNLVFSINVRDFNATVTGYFRYRRTAKEPIVLSDYATTMYQQIVFTAVIPKVPKLRLDRSEIHADLIDISPVFYIGPKAVNSTDPDVQSSFATFLLTVPIAARENFLFLSPLFTGVVIQNYICDFGLKQFSI